MVRDIGIDYPAELELQDARLAASSHNNAERAGATGMAGESAGPHVRGSPQHHPAASVNLTRRDANNRLHPLGIAVMSGEKT